MLLQPSSTRSSHKPHPPINELATVMALSRQPLPQTGINPSPLEMGAVQGKRTVFSTRSCIGGQQWPTQSQPGHFQSEAQRWPCSPTSPYLTLSAEAEPITELTSQDESFMPDISGYIHERVKCTIFPFHVGFEALKLTQAPLQPSCDLNHTHLLVSFRRKYWSHG